MAGINAQRVNEGIASKMRRLPRRPRGSERRQHQGRGQPRYRQRSISIEGVGQESFTHSSYSNQSVRDLVKLLILSIVRRVWPSCLSPLPI
jgi:hypothetical protein